MTVKDKVAIITGAGRGIGRALAVEFALNGARVVACARTEADIQETADIIRTDNGTCLPMPVDVSDRTQVKQMVDNTLGEFGQIDIMFNNAARIPVINALWEVDPDLWWEELAVNLHGPMICINAVLPHMMRRDSGVIINMSGGSFIPGRTSYSCSKAALIRMTELLAKELAAVDSKILAFGMSPGLVKTKRTRVEAETPEGIRWNPLTRQAFENGDDRPPEDCARATIKLLATAELSMNGKIFSTPDIL